MSKSHYKDRSWSNRNSRIVTNGSDSSWYARTTFTKDRDAGSLNVLVETDSSKATAFVLNKDGTTLELNGHEARTMFLTLQKHYGY